MQCIECHYDDIPSSIDSIGYVLNIDGVFNGVNNTFDKGPIVTLKKNCSFFAYSSNNSSLKKLLIRL